MKIESVYGCTYGGVYIDDVSVYDFPIEEKRIILEKLLNMADEGELNNIIQSVVENVGAYFSDDEPCDQCGDTYSSYTIMLEDE